ncbi:MAG: MurT ligase domain-containing protein [Fusobacteria bacterium]|nr:MurT ligase domain-containing protein [Fusobacteriota bacterium]
MRYIALIVGKLLKFIGNKLDKGTSAPGVFAKKIDKKIFSRITYPEKIVVITGTNGKTSTANMVAKVLRDKGLEVVHNTKGANLLGGLLTTIIDHTSFSFRITCDVLVLEVDEATYPAFTKYITPSHLIVNNFFRDQLDRYGEIEVLVDLVNSGISSETTLILNGDDPLVRYLGYKNSENRVVYFGLAQTKYSVSDTEQVREGKFCPVCGSKLNYLYYHYSQLGNYSCSCGFSRPVIQVEAYDVDLKNKEFKVDDMIYKIGYDNLYFIYNSLAAMIIGDEFNISRELMKASILDFKVDDGRMENYLLGQNKTYLNLVKNPTGLNQSLEHILRQEDEAFNIFLALNNLAADGTDTSWIWDVDFEQLKTSNINKFYCSGLRAFDLAVRLKYAFIEEEKLIVIPDLSACIEEARQNNNKTYILSTYTALQRTRRILGSLKENGGDR